MKFTPGDGSPSDLRWRDLLVCEALALELLAEAGVEVSQARVVDVGARRFLEVARFDRGLNPIHHTTFGVGAHRCVSAGLARMEMIVFLQEWLGALPEFAIDPARPVTMKAGNVGTLTSLPLIWD